MTRPNRIRACCQCQLERDKNALNCQEIVLEEADVEDAKENDEAGMLLALDGSCGVDWFGQAIHNNEDYYGSLDCRNSQLLHKVCPGKDALIEYFGIFHNDVVGEISFKNEQCEGEQAEQPAFCNIVPYRSNECNSRTE